MASPPPSPPPLHEMWLPEFDDPLWDAHALSVLSPLSPSDSESVAETPRSRASKLAVRRRRAYRSRKKSEASELRTTLEVLVARRDGLWARREAYNSRLLAVEARRSFAKGWRGVAVRQFKRRTDAERLNRELRVQLVESHRQAQQLVGLLTSHRSLLDATRLRSLLSVQPSKETLRFSPRDMPTVHALAAEVAGLIRDAGDVLGQCKLPPLAATQAYNYSRAWRREGESNNEYLELVEARRVAFAFDVAVAALEETLTLMYATQCQPALLHLADDMLALKFSMSGVDETQRPRRFEAVYVGKMVVEGGRAVLCWRSVSCDLEASNQLQETGWGMVERSNAAASDDGTSFTYFSRIEGEKKVVEMVEATDEETVVWFDAMEEVVLQRGVLQR